MEITSWRHPIDHDDQNVEQIKTLLSRSDRENLPNASLRERALKWVLHFNLEHLHGPVAPEIREDELLVVCLVRDGRPWVDSFVEHYRKLGAKHVVFLDNSSTDGTPQAAGKHEDVTVLRTNLPFKVYQMAMKQYLMERFGRRRWVLCVDVDELFDYPYSDLVSLKDLLGYLDSKSYTAVAAQMLDMFSGDPLTDAAVDGADEDLKERYDLYDVSNIYRQEYSESPLAEVSGDVPDNGAISVFRGGIQESTFGSLALLTKHPLVFMDEQVTPMDGTAHAVSNASVADISCVLLHYKFTRRLYEQVRKAVAQENYMWGSHKHKKHLEVLEKTSELRLASENARKLEGVDELVHNGFLAVPADYMKLVGEKEREKEAGSDGAGRLMEAFVGLGAEFAKQSRVSGARVRELEVALAQQERANRRLERQNERISKRNENLTARLQDLQRRAITPGGLVRLPARALSKVRKTYTVSQGNRLMEKHLESVKKYCMFVGYPRSGHSLIGSLLDAHPDAVIAHELDALKFVEQGVDRKELYRLLFETSRQFARSGGEWEGYGYRVPGQWQGKFGRLEVIGDKKGGASTQTLEANPDVLGKLRETVRVEVKLIHVIRNPYDNISTMFNQRRANRSLHATIKKYFSMCATNARLKDRVGASMFDVRHEDFVRDPKTNLARLCEFLELEYTGEYLEDCAGLVFESPKKTRDQIKWRHGTFERVQDGIDRYDFLKGYSFES